MFRVRDIYSLFVCIAVALARIHLSHALVAAAAATVTWFTVGVDVGLVQTDANCTTTRIVIVLYDCSVCTASASLRKR